MRIRASAAFKYLSCPAVTSRVEQRTLDQVSAVRKPSLSSHAQESREMSAPSRLALTTASAPRRRIQRTRSFPKQYRGGPHRAGLRRSGWFGPSERSSRARVKSAGAANAQRLSGHVPRAQRARCKTSRSPSRSACGVRKLVSPAIAQSSSDLRTDRGCTPRCRFRTGDGSARCRIVAGCDSSTVVG